MNIEKPKRLFVIEICANSPTKSYFTNRIDMFYIDNV